MAAVSHRVIGRGTVVSMLGDQAVTDGDGLALSALPKVRRVGGYVYGVCGDCRVCDVAVRWKLPAWDGSSPERWVVDVLAPVVRERMRDCGERGSDLGLLLGVGGVILTLDSDLAVTVSPWGYGAVGSGSGVALGSLATTPHWPWKSRLWTAVKAAERHCSASVRGRGRIVTA